MRSKLSNHRRRRPLALEPIEPRRLMAFGAELVADINQLTYSPPTNPGEITDVGGIAFYVAKSDAAGYELWKSDGTQAGTALVKDIAPGPASSSPHQLTNVNGTLFFTVHTLHEGMELWRSDGTEAGTALVQDINPAGNSSPADLVNLNGTLLFTANDSLHGRELWKSDGTTDGTVMIRDIVADAGSPEPFRLFAASELVFFVAIVQGQTRLWRTDGTSAGTFRISENGSPDAFAEVNGSVFFTDRTAAAGTELWITDGTSVNTRLIADIKPGAASSTLSHLTNVNGIVFFGADDGQHGQELWKSDGTAEGTTLVRDLDIGPIGYPGSFGPRNLINFNGTLFFTDRDSSSIWKSDGTELGTVSVYGAQGSRLAMQTSFTQVGGALYFANREHSTGNELWKTNGTNAGTVLVKDIYLGRTYDDYDWSLNDSNPGYLRNVGGKLIFRATDVDSAHLWVSGGTAATTIPLDKGEVYTFSGDVRPEIELNGELIFSATDGNEPALWISDGTALGTTKLAALHQANNFVNINGTVYFAGSNYDFQHSRTELWKTDGTAAGTLLVKDINTDFGYGSERPYYFFYGSEPIGFTDLGDKIVFSARNNDDGRELWVTDGTRDGTVMLKDLYRHGESDPGQFTRLGDAVYFTAYGPAAGVELWRTNGTVAGTQRITDIKPGVGSSHPLGVLAFRNKLYFSADDGVHGRELWQSDGTAAGTVMLKELMPDIPNPRIANFTLVQGTLYFTTSPDGGDKLLWKTDGTADGTVFIANIGTATELTNANGTLFFSSDVGGTGAELWTSNGTAAGTVRIKDLIAGPGGSSPRELQEANGVLFFEADLPNGGRAFWLSNGTVEGTVPVLNDPAPLTGMRFLTNVNGQLFFAGTDVKHGEELWKLTTSNPTVQFSGSMTYKENAPLQLIAPFATISGSDNASFPGGRLSVVIGANAGVSDRIEIRNQGNGSGQIGVSGRTIRYGGVVIGSYRDGLPGSQLIIDLNANTSATIVQTLLRNIGYRNVSDDPSTKPRTVTVTLTDGSGGISVPISKTISVTAVNDAPKVVLGGQLAYKSNASPILLAPSATVSDPDSANFYNGVLTVDITSGGGPSNRLLVGGAYSIQSGQLLRNGVVVGTVLSPGIGWRELSIRFNAQMNAAKVQELIRSLRFGTVDNSGLSSRIVSFTLTDGDGGVSETRSKTVNVTN